MSKYLKYIIENVSPLRISDNSTSQSGQSTSLKHIPGTTIRGYVINKLSERDTFQNVEKKLLFSNKIRFLNAYLTTAKHELLRSPKGFYENKDPRDNNLESVLENGDISDGKKRAGLGRYCYFENNCIYYYNLETESDMRIRIGAKKEQGIFRNECIKSGYEFTGYIAFDDETILDDVRGILQGNIYLGNGRSQGLGRCSVLKTEIVDEIPFIEYAVKENVKDECYLMLISHGTMRDTNGEFCGLALCALEQDLGIKNLKIDYASTSIVNVNGYNRIYRSKTPSVPMYEQGSVFRLSFDGEIQIDKMLDLMNSGIGIRKNEGFGRILFLNGYHKLNIKQKCDIDESKKSFDKIEKYSDDDETLSTVASNYYRMLIERKIKEKVLDGTNSKGLAGSQIGNVQSILEKNKYNPDRCIETIDMYFSNELKKEKNKNIHNEKKSIEDFANYIQYILKAPLKSVLGLNEISEVMGISVSELIEEKDEEIIKINYLLNLIKYEKKGKED